MKRKIGRSLEKYLQSREAMRPSIPEMRIRVEKRTTQYYTIECPHCRRFFEFMLEVKG